MAIDPMALLTMLLPIGGFVVGAIKVSKLSVAEGVLMIGLLLGGTLMTTSLETIPYIGGLFVLAASAIAAFAGGALFRRGGEMLVDKLTK